MPPTCTRVGGMTSFYSRDAYVRLFLNPLMGPLAAQFDLAELADALTVWTPAQTDATGRVTGSPSVVVRESPSWIDALTRAATTGAYGSRHHIDSSPAVVRAHSIQRRYPDLGSTDEVLKFITTISEVAAIVLTHTGPRRAVPFTVID